MNASEARDRVETGGGGEGRGRRKGEEEEGDDLDAMLCCFSPLMVRRNLRRNGFFEWL